MIIFSGTPPISCNVLVWLEKFLLLTWVRVCGKPKIYHFGREGVYGVHREIFLVHVYLLTKVVILKRVGIFYFFYFFT